MKFLSFLLLWLAIATFYTLRSPYRKMFGLAERGLPMTAQTFEKTDPPHAKARYHYVVEGKTYTGEDEIQNETDRVAVDYPMEGVYLPEDPSFSSVRDAKGTKEAAESERNMVVVFDLLAAPAIACILWFFASWLIQRVRPAEK